MAGSCTPAPPFQQSAFVWQRDWSPALKTTIQQKPSDLAELLILAGEVEWSPTPHFQRSEADLEWLAAQNMPMGLAIRVNTPSGQAETALQTATLQAVQTLRAAATVVSFVPAELHLDIDMPTAKLADYARWLPAVRDAWPGIPLTITGLPDWLSPGSDLDALLSAVDGWVLQLHWLRKTKDTYQLIDENESRKAVLLAAQRHRPFRVALPTYRQHGVRAPSALLAQLVADWQQDPPPHMQGIIWFRLPVPGDTNTLPMPAWNAIRAGRVPTVHTQVTVSEAPPAWDLKIQNVGEDEIGYTCILVHWSGGMPEAMDIFGASSVKAGQLKLGIKRVLRPQASSTIGWIRLKKGERIDGAEVVAHSSCADLDQPPGASD